MRLKRVAAGADAVLEVGFEDRVLRWVAWFVAGS
jgi:hypothetical protein